MAIARGKFAVEIQGLKMLKARMAALGEGDTPNTTAALDDGRRLIEREARRRGPRAMKITESRVAGSGVRQSIRIKAKGPQIKSMEFGRVWYQRGYRRAKGRYRGGTRFRVPLGRGFRQRRIFGIINYRGGAWGASQRRVREMINQGVVDDTYRKIPGVGAD